MKVGIVGYGFVGRALASVMNEKANVFICEKTHPKFSEQIWKMREMDIVFVCVPTPCDDKPDLTSLSVALCNLHKVDYGGVVVIRSTVLPNFAHFCRSHVPGRAVVFYPEFLTEANAESDIRTCDYHVLGGDLAPCKEVAKFLRKYTEMNLRTVHFTTGEEAMMIKYMRNMFLALKVTFMNEMRHAHEQNNFRNWEAVVQGFSADPRIGPSHTRVPGPDGKYGFGGSCLPKDTRAWTWMQRSLGRICHLPAEILKLNSQFRK